MIYGAWIQLVRRPWNILSPSTSSQLTADQQFAQLEPSLLQMWKNHLQFLLRALPAVFMMSNSKNGLYKPSSYFQIIHCSKLCFINAAESFEDCTEKSLNDKDQAHIDSMLCEIVYLLNYSQEAARALIGILKTEREDKLILNSCCCEIMLKHISRFENSSHNENSKLSSDHPPPFFVKVCCSLSLYTHYLCCIESILIHPPSTRTIQWANIQLFSLVANTVTPRYLVKSQFMQDLYVNILTIWLSAKFR